jgi:predicted metalloprotease
VPELDDVIRGFLLLRDPVGEDPSGQQAHGSYFDRVSGFYDGFDGGVAACRDDFGSDRLFTQAEFTSAADYQNKGNADYQTTLKIVQETLPPFWQKVFPAAFHKQFDVPQLKAFQGNAPSCGDRTNADSDLSYCPKDKTVYYDEKDLIKPAYDIGDFAVATAISLPYALAARSELGKSTDDAAATKSAVCLTGWYAARVFSGDFAGAPAEVTLSPGDIDESVEFLLKYGVSDKVFPRVHESGFELVGAFRDGFLQGGKNCDVGL